MQATLHRAASSFARRRALASATILCCLALNLGGGPFGARDAAAACGDTVLVRSAKTYSKVGTSTVLYVDTCTVMPVPGRRFLLEVLRPGGSNALTSAQVAYGGVEYFGTDDVDATNTLLSRVITPKGADSTLRVTLVGGSGTSSLVVRVTQAPEPLYSVYATSLSGATSPKSYTKYFGFVEEVPTSPHVMVLRNGNASLSDAARSQGTEVWVNGGEVVLPGEVTYGRAYLTRDVMLYAENTVQVNFPSGQSGNSVRLSFYGTDDTAPALTVSAPTDDPADTLVTKALKVLGTAYVEELQTPARLFVNGVEKALTNGSWGDSLSLPAQDGKTTLSFVAQNGSCLSDSTKRVVVRDTQAPTLVVTWPEESPPSVPADSTEITVSGTWVDSTWTVIRVDGDTLASGYSGPSPRAFACRVPLDLGPNRIVIQAFDAAGNADTLVRYTYRTPSESIQPRDTTRAALGVSDLSATEATSFRSAIRFLYTGGDPVQAGLADSILVDDQEAVISGRVFARDFGGMPNVVVNVFGHPEFGSTSTRVDGSFDLVVNGGSHLTLRFRKPGFLEAQRDVHVPAQDYVILDDLALIGQRSRADSVNTGSAAQAVVTRFESDANGDRKLTLLFAPATICSVTTSGGTQAYSDFHVRVKEFTVGGDGDESMPAGLPPTTAYTYCVDLSVDEAVEQAENDDLPADVTFSQPVVAYVKEFLGVPVGKAMPSGYYDQRRAEWVAGEDGTIVRITSISGGLANFDINGDGVADSLGALATLGITTSEREQVAQRFAPGDSLWRMRIQHFSPHDFNLNMAMLASSGSRLHANAQSLGQLVGAPEATCGCEIENENRVLGETIPVQGTPFSLHYRSNRQPGDKAMRTLRIPLVGSPLPTDLKRIRIRVDVAGRRYAHDLNSGDIYANQVYVFDEWDGCDRYGRPIIGSVAATVRVGLEFISSWALQSGTNNSYGSASVVPETGGVDAHGERSVGRLVWTTQRVSIGAPNMASAGLGGWTISPHHYFDPNGRGTFWGGDGSFRYGYRNYPVVFRYAGDGRSSINNGDPPTEGAPVLPGSYQYSVSPQDLAIGVNDSLYFTDQAHHLVLCISPDKRWHRVAGAGGSGAAITEGAQATSVLLDKPQGLTVARDGTVYFADWGLYRVFKVTPDGRIFTVAGTGSPTSGVRQEDTLAMAWPLEQPWSVAIGPDGGVFISDYGDDRVLRMDTNGRIRTYAGRLDGSTPSEDRYVEGKAVGLGVVGPRDVATDPQGNLYVPESFYSGNVDVVWKVTPDGRRTIHTAAPWLGPQSLAFGPDGLLWVGSDNGAYSTNGVYRVEADGTRSLIAGGHLAEGNFSEQYDGQFARGMQFASNKAIALDSRGVLFAGHIGAGNGASGISRISPELPGASAGDIVFPSEDGRERYIFNANGRHLRTEDAITGRLRYTFGYTSGQLTSISEVNGRTTTIHRSGGAATSIEAPFGQVTALALDANGFLESVANAKNETHSLEYFDGGLLKEFTNPRAKSWDYTYSSSDGRLLSDTDPENGGNSLPVPNVTDTTLTVTRTTAEGRTTTYDIVQMLDGVRRRLVHRPAYGATTVDVEVDSMAAATPYGEVNWSKSATGVETAERPGRDPKLGWLAPVSASSVTKLPVSQQQRTVAASRSWTNAERVFTETATLNSAPYPYSAVYDTLTHLLTLTTPAQRTVEVALNGAGQPASVETGTLMEPVAFHYDGSGRLKHLAQGARAWRYTYDARGRLETVTDTLGRVSTYRYDLADRESLLTLPGDRVIRFRYDANGNLEGLTPPGGDEHAFAYTDVDLNDVYTPPTVAGIADPASRYTYNADRQLTDVERPDGSQVRLRYSSSRGWLDSLAIARGRTTLTHAGPAGQLSAAVSPDSVVSTYAWDGPVLLRETWSGAASGAVARTLNSAFAEATQTVVVGNDSSTVSYTYGDADQLLTGVSIAGAAESITRRSEDGLITGTSVTAGGGTVTSTLDYNVYGELSSLSYAWPGGGAFEQEIERDALGRITQITETAADSTYMLGYHYDAAGRLDEVKREGAVVRSYVYDDSLPGNGNRTKEKDGSGAVLAIGSYDGQDRLSSYGGTAYEWTANGELARQIAAGSDTTRTTYDELGNLTGAHLPGVTGDSLTYVIDAGNRRVGRLVNGQRTHTWLYANPLNVVAELVGTGALRHRYVYGTQGHVPDLLVHGDTLYRLVTDHLGSVRAVVRVSDGEEAQRLDYDAWGVRTLDTSPGWQSLGYAGGLTDTSTGLVRFGARDYEPGVGRWTAKDPIGFAGAKNFYTYTGGRPLDRVDVDGRASSGLHRGTVFNLTDKCILASGSNPYGSGQLQFWIAPRTMAPETPVRDDDIDAIFINGKVIKIGGSLGSLFVFDLNADGTVDSIYWPFATMWPNQEMTIEQWRLLNGGLVPASKPPSACDCGKGSGK